jgi:ABC-type lipoprotein release transport system permease subunit
VRRRFVPWAYPVRSLVVRWQAAVFSAIGIAMTVAVLCGVFALRNGLDAMLAETGAEDVVIYLRPGATSEGESGIPIDRVNEYKVRPEIARDERGQPLAAGEGYLALFLERRDGGRANIPVRGIEEASLAIQGHHLRVVEGRTIHFGANELMVGRPIADRIANARMGETLVINVTPFQVVGVFEHDGAYRSEIWGDVDRIAAALERPVRNRVVAKMDTAAGWTAAKVAAELKGHRTLESKVASERQYFASQTELTGVLQMLGLFLTVILGIAAVLGAANTMLAAIGARTREIGVLRALGFGGLSILLSFLVEALLIGFAGGVVGALVVLPLNGLQTGTMSWDTFTEVTFAFRVDPPLLGTAVLIAMGLGLLGGLVPSWRASRMKPVTALRLG